MPKDLAIGRRVQVNDRLTYIKELTGVVSELRLEGPSKAHLDRRVKVEFKKPVNIRTGLGRGFPGRLWWFHAKDLTVL